MDINEQLGRLLANLGVELEQSACPGDDGSIPEATVFQSSRDQYGVFYRLDSIQQVPQLRIFVPVETGAYKIEHYLVCLSERMPTHSWFTELASYTGSSAFERGRKALVYHLLQAVGELMKELFWAGDLERMCFPLEITVQRLI
jgi:hypothetical protein